MWSRPAVLGLRPRRSRETTTSVMSKMGKPSRKTGTIQVTKLEFSGKRNWMPITASRKPRNSDPTSPMKMRAGGKL